MKRGRAVIWDSLFTVLAVYKEILPGSLFTTGAEFWVQSCLISKWSCFMVSHRTLGSDLLFLCGQYSGAAGLCSQFDRDSSPSPEWVLPLNQPLGKALHSWRIVFFAWVEGDSRSQQQQVFGPDIMNQAGRVYIPWNLNNLGSHLCCLTATLFHGWCWDLLLFNILILISASWSWNLKVSLGIIVSRFAKWLFKACRPSLLPCI